MAARFRKFGVTTVGACAGLGLAGWALNPFDRQYVHAAAIATPRVKRKLPPRSEQVSTLQSGEEYDVIVIGGGATGAGCALDAITRGICIRSLFSTSF